MSYVDSIVGENIICAWKAGIPMCGICPNKGAPQCATVVPFLCFRDFLIKGNTKITPMTFSRLGMRLCGEYWVGNQHGREEIDCEGKTSIAEAQISRYEAHKDYLLLYEILRETVGKFQS